jgi:hypothetical protein
LGYDQDVGLEKAQTTRKIPFFFSLALDFQIFKCILLTLEMHINCFSSLIGGGVYECFG